MPGLFLVKFPPESHSLLQKMQCLDEVLIPPLCRQEGHTPEDLTSAFGRCKMLHKVTLWGDVTSEVWITSSPLGIKRQMNHLTPKMFLEVDCFFLKKPRSI